MSVVNEGIEAISRTHTQSAEVIAANLLPHLPLIKQSTPKKMRILPIIAVLAGLVSALPEPVADAEAPAHATLVRASAPR
jgi:hypothetical protein